MKNIKLIDKNLLPDTSYYSMLTIFNFLVHKDGEFYHCTPGNMYELSNIFKHFTQDKSFLREVAPYKFVVESNGDNSNIFKTTQDENGDTIRAVWDSKKCPEYYHHFMVLGGMILDF